MKLTYLLFVCIALVSADIAEDAFLYSLKSNEFGKTILQTLQITVSNSRASNNFLDKVLEIIYNLRTDLVNEQTEDDKHRGPEYQSCVAHVDETAQVIKSSSEARVLEERKVPVYQEQLRDLSKQVSDKQGLANRNTDRITDLSKERRLSRNLYEERRAEQTGYVAALQEAKKIIHKLKSGNSFLQTTSSVINDIQNHQNKFHKRYPNERGFHGMVSMLMELSNDPGIQANQQGVQKIVSVIEELVDSIYDVMKRELQIEQARQNDFEHQKARLQLEITRLEGTIAELLAKVEVANQTLLELSNDIATKTSIEADKTNEKRHWEKTCADQKRTGEQIAERRAEQLSIIRKLADIFNSEGSQRAVTLLEEMKFD